MNCAYWKVNVKISYNLDLIEDGVPLEFDTEPQPFQYKMKGYLL